MRFPLSVDVFITVRTTPAKTILRLRHFDNNNNNLMGDMGRPETHFKSKKLSPADISFAWIPIQHNNPPKYMWIDLRKEIWRIWSKISISRGRRGGGGGQQIEGTRKVDYYIVNNRTFIVIFQKTFREAACIGLPRMSYYYYLSLNGSSTFRELRKK